MARSNLSRLAQLRVLMKERDVQVYIVPSEDCHNSEYIADCDARREFISGFSGSAGCVVVSSQAAALATDGRYFSQASRQLDSGWTLLKQGLRDVPTWQEWAAQQSSGGKTVAVDPTLLSGAAAHKLNEEIRKAGGSDLMALNENLVDIVWANHRPNRPRHPILALSEVFTGSSVVEKLVHLRRDLAKRNCSAFFISALDETAWLFNLRGSDIPYNPLFFSYAIITPEEATLYVDRERLEATSEAYLAANKVSIKPYAIFFEDARRLRTTSSGMRRYPADSKSGVFIMSSKGSWALQQALGGKDLVEEIRSPVADAKSVKNETEMAGMRACHIRDGSALIEFFAWIEDQLLDKRAALDEVQAAEKLQELRSKKKHFVGLSFPTISSSGPNAAIIHYEPKRPSCAVIDPSKIYLCDSGAQYLDGTTDTTRTLHFGQPSHNEKRAYTLVLKGLIALDVAIFPKGTTGFALDCLARQHLWRYGLDYRHGTGHGVGSYLNVHEGPIGIGTRIHYTEVPLACGNVLSNEPGYYDEGHYGIRIENMMIVKEVDTQIPCDGQSFLGFEHVTMVPYCRKLIDEKLLTTTEKVWINKYNAWVLDLMLVTFKNDPVTTGWLIRETQPI